MPAIRGRVEVSKVAGRPDALQEVWAAHQLATFADAQGRSALVRARSEGASWSEIAEGLGLGVLAVTEWGSLGDGRGWPSWRCRACGGWVSDVPWKAHPDHAEPGHELSCPRRQAALATYREVLASYGLPDVEEPSP